MRPEILELMDILASTVVDVFGCGVMPIADEFVVGKVLIDVDNEIETEAWH